MDDRCLRSIIPDVFAAASSCQGSLHSTELHFCSEEDAETALSTVGLGPFLHLAWPQLKLRQRASAEQYRTDPSRCVYNQLPYLLYVNFHDSGTCTCNSLATHNAIDPFQSGQDCLGIRAGITNASTARPARIPIEGETTTSRSCPSNEMLYHGLLRDYATQTAHWCSVNTSSASLH